MTILRNLAIGFLMGFDGIYLAILGMQWARPSGNLASQTGTSCQNLQRFHLKMGHGFRRIKELGQRNSRNEHGDWNQEIHQSWFDILGCSINGGPPKLMVYFIEIPLLAWMMTGGTPLTQETSGNPLNNPLTIYQPYINHILTIY